MIWTEDWPDPIYLDPFTIKGIEDIVIVRTSCLHGGYGFLEPIVERYVSLSEVEKAFKKHVTDDHIDSIIEDYRRKRKKLKDAFENLSFYKILKLGYYLSNLVSSYKCILMRNPDNFKLDKCLEPIMFEFINKVYDRMKEENMIGPKMHRDARVVLNNFLRTQRY